MEEIIVGVLLIMFFVLAISILVTSFLFWGTLIGSIVGSIFSHNGIFIGALIGGIIGQIIDYLKE